MKRNRPDHYMQVACVKWFRLQHSKYSKCLFAVPNGGSRNKLEAKSLKIEGVTPGVSDLFLALPNKDFAGFFIEMKTKDGKLSKNQDDFLKMMRLVGYKGEVVRSFDAFKRQVNDYVKNR